MNEKVLLIIIVIIGLGIGLYLYTSGAFISGFNGITSFFSFSSSSPIFTLAGFGSGGSSTNGWNFTHPVTLPPLGGTQNNNNTITSITPPAPTNTVNGKYIPAGYSLGQISPYYGEVRMNSVTAGNSYYYGTISLGTSFAYNATGTIDITGWQIKSRNSGEYIPQAINVYDPSGLTPASDIRVKNGDTILLYSSSAPFNLRLNECTGYIGHMANFMPALPLYCPYVDRSQIQNFTGQCQNYIESIGACQAPDMSSPQISQTDYACRDYLQNNFTYKSCFNAHQNDANFLSNQIWVWMGSNVVDSIHDNVVLLDKNGLVVDVYAY